jgi:ADP-heptose:LPS heptosyltransferase
VHVDVMRRIDRWVGVPLCFLLTMARRLTTIVASRPASGTPRQVLLIETAEMGSLVLAFPAVRHLRTAYPGCGVHVLVFAKLRDSVSAIQLTADADVLTIDAASLFTIARDVVRFMVEARRRRIDTVVNLEMFGRLGAILTALSGAERRVGFHPFNQRGLYCGDFLTHRVGYNPHIHTSLAFLTLVQALGEPDGDIPMGKFPLPDQRPVAPQITIDPAARDRMRDRLIRERPAVAGKRLVVINPNASPMIPIRRWPLNSYIELVRRLVSDPENACVMTGSREEREDARAIATAVDSDRIVDLSGQTSIRDLLDLYSCAELLVTNDSGPAQLAAVTSVHVMVLFGPETPELYQPIAAPDRCTVMYSHYACSPCVSAFNQRKTDCNDNRCLKTIAVDTVHAAAREVLARRAGMAVPSL